MTQELTIWRAVSSLYVQLESGVNGLCFVFFSLTVGFLKQTASGGADAADYKLQFPQ